MRSTQLQKRGQYCSVDFSCAHEISTSAESSPESANYFPGHECKGRAGAELLQRPSAFQAKAGEGRAGSLATALHSFRSSTNCSRGLEEEGSTFAAKSVHETSKAKPTDRAKSVICLGENSCHSNCSRLRPGYSRSTKSRSFFILLFSRTVPRAVFSSRSP